MNAKPVLINAAAQAGDGIFLLETEAMQACSENFLQCITDQVYRELQSWFWASAEPPGQG